MLLKGIELQENIILRQKAEAIFLLSAFKKIPEEHVKVN